MDHEPDWVVRARKWADKHHTAWTTAVERESDLFSALVAVTLGGGSPEEARTDALAMLLAIASGREYRTALVESALLAYLARQDEAREIAAAELKVEDDLLREEVRRIYMGEPAVEWAGHRPAGPIEAIREIFRESDRGSCVEAKAAQVIAIFGTPEDLTPVFERLGVAICDECGEPKDWTCMCPESAEGETHAAA